MSFVTVFTERTKLSLPGGGNRTHFSPHAPFHARISSAKHIFAGKARSLARRGSSPRRLETSKYFRNNYRANTNQSKRGQKGRSRMTAGLMLPKALHLCRSSRWTLRPMSRSTRKFPDLREANFWEARISSSDLCWDLQQCYLVAFSCRTHESKHSNLSAACTTPFHPQLPVTLLTLT